MDRVSGGMNTVSPPLPPASLFRFESRLLRCAQNDTGRSDGRSMRRPYLGFGIRAGTGACPYEDSVAGMGEGDRKSTRLNSSHGYISYAVFCLKKKIEVLALD